MINLIFSKFEKSLKTAKFPTDGLAIEVKQHNPAIFLKILHFVFVDFSAEFNQELVNKGYAFLAMKDVKFVKSLFQLLVKEFSYKPVLTLENFFTIGFLEAKINLCIDCLEIVRQWKKENLKTESKTNRKEEELPSRESLIKMPTSDRVMEKTDKHMTITSEADVEEPRVHVKKLVRLGIDIKDKPDLLEEIKVEQGPLDESCSEKFIENVNHFGHAFEETSEFSKYVIQPTNRKSNSKNPELVSSDEEGLNKKSDIDTYMKPNPDHVNDKGIGSEKLLELLIQTNQVILLEFQRTLRISKTDRKSNERENGQSGSQNEAPRIQIEQFLEQIRIIISYTSIHLHPTR
jgi:hypothetical protein